MFKRELSSDSIDAIAECKRNRNSPDTISLHSSASTKSISEDKESLASTLSTKPLYTAKYALDPTSLLSQCLTLSDDLHDEIKRLARKRLSADIVCLNLTRREYQIVLHWKSSSSIEISSWLEKCSLFVEMLENETLKRSNFDLRPLALSQENLSDFISFIAFCFLKFDENNKICFEFADKNLKLFIHGYVKQVDAFRANCVLPAIKLKNFIHSNSKCTLKYEN